MNETYAWRGGTEMLLRHGTGARVTVLVLPALFEEANRMRRFTVQLMRALAESHIGSVLPDLPGTGESPASLDRITLDDWHGAAAAAAAATGAKLVVSIRGGALLDGFCEWGWRLAPDTAARLLRDLVRATALSKRQHAATIDKSARSQITLLAGNPVNPGMYGELMLAQLRAHGRRTARLVADAGPRDVSLDGQPIWRSTEPDDQPELVRQAARDIAEWIAVCGG